MVWLEAENPKRRLGQGWSSLGLQPELQLRSPDCPAGSFPQPTLRCSTGQRDVTGRNTDWSLGEFENTELKLDSTGPGGAHTLFSPKEMFIVTCDFNDKQKKSIGAHCGSRG